MDLIIRNARLSARAADGPLDIGIGQGRIVTIERHLTADDLEVACLERSSSRRCFRRLTDDEITTFLAS